MHYNVNVRQYKIWNFDVQTSDFEDRNYKGYEDRYYSNRAIMIEFLKDAESEFFIEAGISISCQHVIEFASMRKRFTILASMTQPQHVAWEQREFLKKMAT